MNLTWQIIKKDLLHLRWGLAVWLGCFLYLFFFHNRIDPRLGGSLGDFYLLTALLLLALLSFSVLARFVQSDHPVDSTAFWRTRPITPGRLVTAKLLLIGALFIGLPLLVVFLKVQFSTTPPVSGVRDYGIIALLLASLSLSVVAAAACTKNLLQCLLLWVGLIFATAGLFELFSRLAPKGKAALGLPPAAMLAIMGFSAVVSLAIVLNQYLRRGTVVSIILLATGSVGAALIGGMWTYYYFYQA